MNSLSLDLSPEPWFPKFLVAHAEDETKPLSKVSPFLIAKEIEKIIGKSYKAKKLSSGDIQIEVENRSQSSALVSIKKLGDIPVSITKHRILNIVKGVISESELLDCSDIEIEEGLREHGVVAARRIVMRRDGKEMQTKHIVLSFQLHRLPQTIKAGYLNCHVRPYVPNPRRCFKCQRFGHGSQVCRGQETCPKCSGNGHTPELCENPVRCANCKGDHPVYSRSCPRWKAEKEILRIKAEQNIPYKAAKAQAEFASKGTFSEVARRGVAPLRKSVETQTSGCLPQTPQQKGGDTSVSLPAPTSPGSTLARQARSKEIATVSSDVDGTISVWDGTMPEPSQTMSQNMELDDDDCLSQKSSSSLPGVLSQGKEKREKTSGRGRGSRTKDMQKLPPRRITPP
ncbi:uncharacterized protein LOC135376493 [Ornithodoros turicata]|uniref:uncharacterized protein LOC135376493 n=1 Tax=Ornithodoros turicata TaxID=34597 RepID=UPI003138DB8D